jgi:hypothetical protein
VLQTPRLQLPEQSDGGQVSNTAFNFSIVFAHFVEIKFLAVCFLFNVPTLISNF